MRAVVRCAASADVVEALVFASRFGLQLAVRGGGHDLAGRSSTHGLLLDLSRLDAVEVADGAVRVGAGASTGALCEQLYEHGLAIPTGTCPSVGIGGLTLGDALGSSDAQGLTCDRLLAAEVVLADGRILNCDLEQCPDLFWALRGAGADSFGVVTEFTFEPLPAPEPPTSFHLLWPYAQAEPLIAAAAVRTASCTSALTGPSGLRPRPLRHSRPVAPRGHLARVVGATIARGKMCRVRCARAARPADGDAASRFDAP